MSLISLTYIGSCIIIGIISTTYKNVAIIPLVLVMYATQNINASIWYILESKYLKNFTKEDMRNKITFAYEFIGAISASIFSIIGGLLLDVMNVENAFLMVGLFALACMTVVLDYMRKRFGLRPEEYEKQDIEFEIASK